MSYILQALRLPIGKANGIYKGIIPETLMAEVLKKLVENTTIHVEELLLANAFGTGGNMGRYAALVAGISNKIPVTTIDSQCSGGLRVVEIADSILQSGNANNIIAGGMESKSMAPSKFYHTSDPRNTLEKSAYKVAQFSPDQEIGFLLLEAAKNVAKKHNISKEEMLDWTVRSHQLAAKELNQKALENYIYKIKPSDQDQSLRPDTDFYKLSTKALIDRTVSAHYNDGAAAVLIGKESIETKPLAKIVGSCTIGWHPSLAPEAILPATEAVLKKMGLQIDDIDLFEVNESFSVIPVIFAKYFNINPEKINILGGNLAYGHPFGASGTINLIHLLAALKLSHAKRGLVVLPAAGGLGTAMIIENVF